VKEEPLSTTFLKRKSIVSEVMGDYAKANALAVDINDQNGLASAHSWLAGSYYIARNFTKVKEHALISIPFLQNDKPIFSEILRGLMLDHVQFGDAPNGVLVVGSDNVNGYSALNGVLIGLSYFAFG